MRKLSFERGVPSGALQLLGAGLGVTAPVYSFQWCVGWSLFACGLFLLIWGLRWRGKPWWQRPWRERPVIYVQTIREPLPPQLPGSGKFKIHSVMPVGDRDHEQASIGLGWRNVKQGSPIGEWHPMDPIPTVERIVVTNHSDQTLADVELTISVRPMRYLSDGSPKYFLEKDFVLHLERIRPGEDYPATTFVTNETPWFLNMSLKGARAQGISETKMQEVVLRTESFPNCAMALWPSQKRWGDKPEQVDQ